jgi:iron complex transport system substrate-binding protein
MASLALAGCAGAPGESPAAATGHVAVSTAPLTDLEILTNPTAYQGPTTAVLGAASIVPIDAAAPQQLPVTVTSHDRGGERQVEVTDASRIVALDIAGSIATTLAGLGVADSLVARDSSTELDGTEELPVVTSSGHTINPEAVLAVRPTLVITDGSIGPSGAFQQLRDAGVTVVYVEDVDGFDGAQELARQVGQAVGLADAGKRLAERIAAEVDAVRADIAAIAPSDPQDRVRMIFLYLRGSAGVYYLFGDEAGADDLIEALGGVDVAAESGITGMAPLTDEAMLAADPDLILVMTDGLASAGGVDGLLADKPAIALTTAGQNKRFVDMADREILGFGPRSAEVLEALARAIYAPDAA